MAIIPISALNQYLYCPRRCYLMHAEGQFTDNVHTLRGSHEHERVDQILHEIKQGVRIEFALPVWSDELGLRALIELTFQTCSRVQFVIPLTVELVCM